jgi:hypothetical protein
LSWWSGFIHGWKGVDLLLSSQGSGSGSGGTIFPQKEILFIKKILHGRFS